MTCRQAGLLLIAVSLLGGCAVVPGEDGAPEGDRMTRHAGGSGVTFSVRTARVSEVQACAIGYDLAQAIHKTVSLKRTVLLAPRRASACERHTLEYLRRAGFRIDARKEGAGARLAISIDQAGRDAQGQTRVSAVAAIGSDLRIARPYRLARTGVYAAGPVSVQHLNPDTYSPRPPGGAGS